MDINKHDRLSNATLRHKVKKQLVVRKDMDINKHDRVYLYPYLFLLQDVPLLCVEV
jgi:hypothetical protein